MEDGAQGDRNEHVEHGGTDDVDKHDSLHKIRRSQLLMWVSSRQISTYLQLLRLEREPQRAQKAAIEIMVDMLYMLS